MRPPRRSRCRRRSAAFSGVGSRPVGREEVQRPVPHVLVVMLAVDAEDMFEVAPAEDEDPIEAICAECSYPAFGVVWGVKTRVHRAGRADLQANPNFGTHTPQLARPVTPSSIAPQSPSPSR